MQVLCDLVVHFNAVVKEINPYVFPSTQQSDKHFSGWHNLDNACQKLPIIKHNINGTKNQHSLSTLIAGIGLTENEMELAYAHFGHNGAINKNIYQVPQAHQQFLSAAKYLTCYQFTGWSYNNFRLNLQLNLYFQEQLMQMWI